MKLTTLCYIEKDDKYLMIHRIKKKHDVNKDKWIGIGGKFERGESPEDCILRETKEETGLTLTSYRLRGVLTFVYNDDDAEMEYIFLYTADGFTGELADCNEGTLEWVPKTEIDSLNLWEGDRIFHRLLDEDAPFFSLKLRYQDDLLKEAVLDGKPLELLDLLDENGEPSGEVRERTLVHLNGDWHRTSHVGVVRRRGDGGHFTEAEPREGLLRGLLRYLQRRAYSGGTGLSGVGAQGVEGRTGNCGRAGRPAACRGA